MALHRAGVFLAGLLVTTAAFAGRGEDLAQKGRASYDDYEFDKAAAYFDDALKAGVKDPKLLEQVRLYLAFSLFGLDKKSDAKKQVRELLRTSPTFKLDAKGLHPDLIAFFDKEKKAYDKELAAERDVLEHSQPKNVVVATPPSPPPQEKKDEPVIVKEAPPAYRSAHPVVKLLPLGIGQFANGDPLGGSLFLVAELALAGVHTTFAVLDEMARLQLKQLIESGGDPTGELGQRTYTYYVIRSVSGAALIGVAVLGIIDAFVWSPGRAEARHKARFSAAPMLTSGGGGVVARITW